MSVVAVESKNLVVSRGDIEGRYLYLVMLGKDSKFDGAAPRFRFLNPLPVRCRRTAEHRLRVLFGLCLYCVRDNHSKLRGFVCRLVVIFKHEAGKNKGTPVPRWRRTQSK